MKAKVPEKLLTCASSAQISDEETCVRFRAEQMVPVGLVQPAAAVVYDYYNPGQL